MANKKANNPSISPEELLASYYQQVYSNVRRLVVAHDDAADVCQDVFLRAFDKIGTLRDPGKALGWLLRIATNESLRFLSKRKFTTGELTERLADAIAQQDDEPDPRLVHLQEALLTLSPTQQTVFNLRHFEELPYDEIAEITGQSPHTSRVVFHQAKEKLKKNILSLIKKEAK